MLPAGDIYYNFCAIPYTEIDTFTLKTDIGGKDHYMLLTYVGKYDSFHDTIVIRPFSETEDEEMRASRDKIKDQLSVIRFNRNGIQIGINEDLGNKIGSNRPNLLVEHDKKRITLGRINGVHKYNGQNYRIIQNIFDSYLSILNENIRAE